MCAYRTDTDDVAVEVFVPDPLQPEMIVNTTGAGDTFASAFIWGFWVQAWPMSRVLKVACKAAALSLKCQEAIPSNVADVLSEV